MYSLWELIKFHIIYEHLIWSTITIWRTILSKFIVSNDLVSVEPVNSNNVGSKAFLLRCLIAFDCISPETLSLKDLSMSSRAKTDLLETHRIQWFGHKGTNTQSKYITCTSIYYVHGRTEKTREKKNNQINVVYIPSHSSDWHRCWSLNGMHCAIADRRVRVYGEIFK